MAAAFSSPSGKSGHSRAISSGPFSVRSAFGKSLRPARSTGAPSRTQVRTSCSRCLARAWVWTSFVTATAMPSRSAIDRAARVRASSPAIRWRATARASRPPNASRSFAAASPSAPG